MKSEFELSIVVPALREEAVIAASLITLSDYLHKADLYDSTEVIVVAADDGGRTGGIAKNHSADFAKLTVIEPPKKVGKGRDVKLGVQATQGTYVIFTDADLATPVSHISEALAELRGGADIVVGVRNLWCIHKQLRRKIASVIANWLVRAFLLPSIPDSQCGFKGFSAASARTVFGKMTIQGWAFDMELLVIAKTHRMKVQKLAIDDWHDPKLKGGLVGESTLKASLQTLKELFRIRKQLVQGLYKPA